jgi:hypothetical protein
MTDIVERLRNRNGRPDGFGIGPVCDAAADEIDRLRLQLERQKNEWLSWDAKRAALEQDAVRYRWLRDKFTRLLITAHPDCDQGEGPSIVREIRVCDHFRAADAASTDAAIDAAMKAP